MSSSISRFIWRRAVALWLRTSEYSWRRLRVADDSPHVHAPGTNPDRILIAGDGASAGVGVRTHDLGLPGYLARSVTELTGRATDADIVVATTMTTAGCIGELSKLELSRFDVILLTLGGNEALGFYDPQRWTSDVTDLLDHIERSAPAATKTIVLSIPYFGSMSRFPRILRERVDRHSLLLNGITSRLVQRRPNVTFVDFTAGEGLEAVGAHSYEVWADHLAPAVVEQLEPPGSWSTRTELVEEASRQHALDELHLLDMPSDAELDRHTTSAKNLFNVPYAAVTLIDHDRQSMISAIGMERIDIPRARAFCDVTIRRPESLAIRDPRHDARYSHNTLVLSNHRVGFYAGYPLESRDGHRIGALCVMDVKPRSFTEGDSALLRQVAQGVQLRLWALSDLAGSKAQ